MANVIKEMPKISRAGGGRKGSKYPLDEWFDGQIRELVDGEDYNTEELGTVKRESLINMLHGKAAGRGLKIHTVKTETGFALVAFAPEATENGSEGDEDATEGDPDEE